MNRISLSVFLTFVLGLIVSGRATNPKEHADKRVYELRTYFAAPGKLDELHARFRDHTMKLFTKHGMENIAYFVPLENPDNKLIYLMAYPNRVARDASWKEFLADPDWKAAAAKSEENGKLVTKVEQIFMEPTDFSPALKKGNMSHDGVFEYRTYTTPEGSLPDLDKRFRDHTISLFAKHGMKSWMYFHKTPDQPAATTTLIYFLAHQSEEAAKNSFDAFRKDPAWIAAKTESEKKGALTVKDGVKSVFLKPTDYSPTK